jgi:chorismate dehydratase
MTVRLGAVGYLNARPLVYGLDVAADFALRYDLPSECARLLHTNEIDVGLIPSIEYVRGGPYWIAPDLAIASSGPVASVALFTTRPMADVRSIALDTSSRTSVALVSVLCARVFNIQPALERRGPELAAMLEACDAALIIGDNALLVSDEQSTKSEGRRPGHVEKIDLGEVWTRVTGLPFVYAFWAGRPGALDEDDVELLQRARDAGVARADAIAREYFPDSPAHQEMGAAYLRDNIKYHLGDEERAGLEAFYRYAHEAGVPGVTEPVAALEFFGR